MRPRWIWLAAPAAALVVMFLAWMPHAQTPSKFEPSRIHSPAPSADEEAGSPRRATPRRASRPQHQPARQHPLQPQLPSGTQEPAAVSLPVTGDGPASNGGRASSGLRASGGGSTLGEAAAAGAGSSAGGELAAGNPLAAEGPPAPVPTPILRPPILLNHSAVYPGDGYTVSIDRSLFAPELRLLASEGRVVVRVLVRADGAVGTVLMSQSSGNDALDRAAVEAASSWRFQPATRDGVAIDAWAIIPVRFVRP